MPKVSVIIPVYNTEKYLSKCIESVINQTLTDLEIICINDCSTDNSLNIIKEYTSKDNRVKLIDLKESHGVSYARNTGIDNAKGNYISFVDSDDCLEQTFLEKLYKKAKSGSPDAVKGNIYSYDDKTETSKPADFYNINNKIRQNKTYFHYGFTSAIYKRTFLMEYNIRFPLGINYFEDPYFSICTAINLNKIDFDDSAKYYYRITDGSLSKNHLKKEKIKDFKKVSSDILNLINKIEITEENYKIIFEFIYNFAYENYFSISIKKEEKELLFDTIIELLINSKHQFRIEKEIYKKFMDSVANGEYYDLLLKCYKEYDCLNNHKNLVRIFVSYIKPSFLFKSDILTPVHLGRAVEREKSKDGEITDKEIEWLHQNCTGDDDFEGNISAFNRRIGFFTGSFWAWRNYDKLGNPEYFGSFGYRRLFFPNCLNNIQNYDLILPVKKEFHETMKNQLINSHGELAYDAMINLIRHAYPEQFKDITDYLNKKEGYFAELYIMKKHLFFEYCEWIYKSIQCFFGLYPAALNIDPNIRENYSSMLSDFIGEDILANYIKFDIADSRDLAFIIERLTGYFLYTKTKNSDIKYKEVTVFEPYIPFKNLSPQTYNKLVLNKMRENVINNFRRKNAESISNNSCL